jgi:hypothetical protein
MPKSRRRKPGPASHRGNQPGNPRHRAARARAGNLTDPAGQAWERLTQLLDFGDPADWLQVISVPPLFLDAHVAGQAGNVPEERCLDDCVILACSYAHLGITAQIRAAVLTVDDTRDRTSTAHGTLTPQWEDDGMLHGHTVVWIPEQRCLIDSTALQFLPWDTPRNPGPVIAHARTGSAGPDSVTTSHGRFRLTYTLASPEAGATAARPRPTLANRNRDRSAEIVVASCHPCSLPSPAMMSSAVTSRRCPRPGDQQAMSGSTAVQ